VGPAGRRLGPGPAGSETAASAAVVLAVDPAAAGGAAERLEALCAAPDRRTSVRALLWCSHAREDAGDPEAAIALATRALALVRDDDGPALRAELHGQLAHLHAGLGRHDDAVEHARLALPVLERLGAGEEDLAQLRAVVAAHALVHGRFDDAERIFATITAGGDRPGFSGDVVGLIGGAELAIARGRVAEGLRLHREAVARVRALRFPGFPEVSGYEPWTLVTEAGCVAAHALHGAVDDAEEVAAELRRKALGLVDPARAPYDHPVLGLVCFALGLWALRRDPDGGLPARDAVRLLALADRLAYLRTMPSTAWSHAVEAAELAAPGLLAEVRATHGDRRGPGLVDLARDVLRETLG
jgi:tetratricopeptide (TPR) repeat protein